MDIAAAVTLTFYFIGLVNFHDRTEGRIGREVIVPAAASGTYAGVALEAHQADLVITGFQGGKTACETNGWTWKDADAPLPETCIIESVSQKVLTLPTSADAFDASNFGSLPKLTSFCCLSDLDSKYLTNPAHSALRVTITNGALSGCTDGGAWVSRLGITATSDKFTFDGKTLTLDDGAVVYVINSPPHPPDPAHEKHFYWYYVLYGATSCRGLPPTPAGSACPDTVLALTYRHGHPAASGVGCSNTGYP